MTDRVESEEIIVVFTAGDSPALGNIWRLTAKNSDFYIDPLGEAGKALHLSAHGPNDRFPDRHRFHMRMDRKKAAQVGDQGHFLRHSIPRRGCLATGGGVGGEGAGFARKLLQGRSASLESVGRGSCNVPGFAPRLFPVLLLNSPVISRGEGWGS